MEILFLYSTDYTTTWLAMILLLPLASFVLSLLTSQRYAWLTGLGAPVMLLASTIATIALLISNWNHGNVIMAIHWFYLGDTAVTINIALSNTALLMGAVVSVISFLVHVYSTGYMAGDAGIKKYFAMLGFFTFAMQGVVFTDNLLVLFVFWELVGFSSYMLIGHWMEKPAAAKAAQKAFVMNRIGDAGFLVGLMILWTQTGSFDITTMLSQLHTGDWQTAAALCIFFGVIGKSAQFPLFSWLPDAMEGPTPVSALIHAATMVAAGVYLLIRIFPLFTDDALIVVAVTGMVTALGASLTALFQYDIKKVLAYSTVSQLGLMMMAIGLGIVNAALLHLVTHAFFKACLFLSAGSVIHSLHHAQRRSREHFDVQDIRNMGGLRKNLPVTFFSFLLSGASLAGIPFFSGFLSKEAILAAIWMNAGILSWSMLIVMISVSFITVLYTFRLIWFVFMGEPRKPIASVVMEVPVVMRGPAIVLALCSLWFVVSWNPFDFVGWLLPGQHNTHGLWITVFSMTIAGVALLVGYGIFRRASFFKNRVLENAFYVDIFYQHFFVKMTHACAGAVTVIDKKLIDGLIHSAAYAHVMIAHITGWFDRAIVDGLVHTVAGVAKTIGAFARSFQGGKIQLYIFWAMLAIIIFLIWSLK